MTAARTPAELNRKRPFGNVYGPSENGAAYEQDHKVFNAAGEEIIEEGAAAAPAPAPAPTPAPAPDPQPAMPVVMKDGQGNLFKAGEILDLEGMELEQLHALAKEMGLELHPLTGVKKVTAAIMEAAPLKPAADEVDEQLNG